MGAVFGGIKAKTKVFRLHQVVLSSLTRRCWALILFMAIAWMGQGQTKSQPRRLSIPLYNLAGNRTYDGGWQLGGGLRYGQHEIAGFYATPFIDDGPFAGAHYRYYLRGSGRPAQPFVGLEGGVGVLPDYLSTSSVFFDLRTRGIYGVAGIELPLWGSLWGFGQLGIGFTDLLLLEDPRTLDDVATVGFVTFGFKYDILLRGERSEEQFVPLDTPGRPRFFLSYRARWIPYSPFVSH